MKRLRPEKLLTIISAGALEETLTDMVRRHGVSGYTMLEASGAGSSGIQTGMLDIDTNILLHVILPKKRISTLLDDLERLMRRGQHLKVFVSDIAVLALGPSEADPRKL